MTWIGAFVHCAAAPNAGDANGKSFAHNKMGPVHIRSAPTEAQLSGPISGAGMAIYRTSDAPGDIFNRLAAIVEADDFFSIAQAQDQKSIPPDEGNYGVMEFFVTVTECDTPTTIREELPLDKTYHVRGNTKLLRVFNDLLTATYQSRWEPDDIF